MQNKRDTPIFIFWFFDGFTGKPTVQYIQFYQQQPTLASYIYWFQYFIIAPQLLMKQHESMIFEAHIISNDGTYFFSNYGSSIQ